jgi:hypothetical protein
MLASHSPVHISFTKESFEEIVMKNRREFLSTGVRIGGSIVLASGIQFGRALHAAQRRVTGSTAEAAARDEGFWSTYRSAFTPDPGHKWFNKLAFSPLPLPRSAGQPRKCSPDEIALTRNTTAGICNVIFSLDLGKGDKIVTPCRTMEPS